ncbi:hypothetical protein LEP1GSC151_3450 [Leptospira interrogans serovar Grippotyphosa str. LT2186]|uniref:Uncharacterized protein n=2 Tax=Leptospira interrogans TaxID=173 RepID=M3I4G0_LEPIR|nr:hypothetical protein LEP1GSC151_3450 [Leptospira interrogans serovar Grippotyphosa str. LT2186]
MLNVILIMKKRNLDQGKSLYQYRDKIFVECPNCSSIATITVQDIRYNYPISQSETIRVVCLACGFCKKSENTFWKGAIYGSFKKPCGNCGYKWMEKHIYRVKFSSDIPKTVKCKCPVCNYKTEEKLQWQKYYSATQGIDPYFGLSLWLKFKIGNHQIWVYNESHINDLIDYVESDLRERIVYPTKWSMVARLPKWIKEAKNRKVIVKALKELNKKLQKSISVFG